MTMLDADWLLGCGDAARRAARLTLEGERVAAVEEGAAGSGALIQPALTNAHDHARVRRASQAGGVSAPPAAWLPHLALIPSVDPWLAPADAFGRSARGGAGAVMAHDTRVQGLTDHPTEAKAVAQAARDVGLGVGFAVNLQDANPLVHDGGDAMLAGLSPAAVEVARRRFMGPPLPPAEIDGEIDDPADVHFAQVKVPLLNAERIAAGGTAAAATLKSIGLARCAEHQALDGGGTVATICDATQEETP